VASSEITIDRPKGSGHPRYPDFVYGLDYGYLNGTCSSDGEGIDVWVGTMDDKRVVAAMVTVDLVQRDSEVKILLGCTDDEIEYVHGVHNETDDMRGILIRR
jgi:inorganic pyrophosphatase